MSRKALLVYLVAWVASMQVTPAEAELTLGIFPRRPATESHGLFSPLADYLSKELGKKVVLVTPKDFPTFWEGVKEKKYDLVHLNQYHYIKSRKEFGYQVFAVNEEQGAKTIRGQLTVRKDSGIRSVRDLKGKVILFAGDPKAMGSYIAPTAILKKAGLIEGKDYTAQFAKNPPSAVFGVYNQIADAAGTGDIISHLQSVTSKIDASQLLVLALSDEFVHLAWATKDSLAETDRQKIQAIMTGLHKTPTGRKILKACQIDHFHAATDADFAKVREITQFVLGEEY